MEPRTRTVGILIFDRVEVLDFCGPFEVFSLARPGDNDRDSPLFQVFTIAEQPGILQCSGGLKVEPHFTFDTHPPLDLLVVPGGSGRRRQMHHAPTLDWIARVQDRAEVTASVCTGAFLLAECGLLDGRRATTHWAAIEELRRYSKVTVLNDTRVVDAGSIVTAAGITAGIDMSLHLVGRLCGPQIAAWTARRMEYTPLPV